MPDTVELIVVDVSRTLGVFTGQTTRERVAELTPLAQFNPSLIGETIRALLYRAPQLTPDLIGQFCDRLVIPFADFPTQWDRGYQPYAHAQHVLEELATIAPVIALSNMSVTGGAERVRAIQHEHSRTLAAVYTSFGLGGAKPEPWLWHHLAGKHEVNIANVVHIGDQLTADVYGAWTAGARVVHLRDDSQPAGYPKDSDERIAGVADLTDALPIIRSWAAE
jgi:FMN phosphatase YigB (HAD superfamily)